MSRPDSDMYPYPYPTQPWYPASFKPPVGFPGTPGFGGMSPNTGVPGLDRLLSTIRRIGANDNPFFTGHFLLRLDGVDTVGAFSEVNGLSATVDTEELVEGGQNEFVHRLPKALRWSNVTLTRGVTAGNELFEWMTTCAGEQMKGKVIRREAAISVVNALYVPIRTWVLHEAYPVKWTGPTMSAKGRDIALESVELVHHGLSIQ